ncbi:beta-galactosidase [Vallitalea longa]|uniref:Beta-galactosidase n=1 Tax=Vallitalea longa TaxID=2936439 RepID=A0A9W6DEL8_9FIRM|nr:glycoside hydrolase family 2 TIM barrel-domain containing protein [Vallitalea longa]GKX29655.1 beta-galactosidase [Vallitalea longa]
MSRVTNINKGWKFVLKECERESLIVSEMKEIKLPHTWNGIDGQDGGNDYYRGVGWYVKELEIEENHHGRIFLDFQGVNSVCDVYLNGQHMGKHEGGYSGFRYDITDYVSSDNILEVAVDNSHIEDVYPLFADFTFYGGIYRDVNIIYTDDIHFDLLDLASSGIYVSQKNITNEKAEVNILAKVVNSGNPSEVGCQISWVDENGGIILTDEQIKTIEKQGEFSFDIEIHNPNLWNGIENPYLYNVIVTLATGNEEIDRKEIPTGLRYFKFDEQEGFFLNGRHMKLRGVSRHQDRESVGNALTEEHQIEDMELIKEVGANSIRLAHYQHNQFFYDLCDKAGMVVWAEIPYISKTSDIDNTASNAIIQMRELIRQNYNHASILMWGVQNEIGIMEEKKSLEQIVREIHDVAKEEDTTRVTTQAQVMMTPEDDPSHYVTDIMAWNKYYGWYVDEVEDFEIFINSFRSKNPNRAFGISEYGAEGILSWHTDNPKVKDYSEEYHALYHEKALKIFNKYDFVWGTYVWNMFDFGSDMRDEGGVKGRNNKGLVTFDRTTRKDAFYWYQSMWSKKPMIHINSKRFVERHTDNIEVKVYSNQDNVTLMNNGNPIELLKKDGTIFLFRVDLTEGDNEIVAVAGDLKDSIIFKKVAEKNMKYVLPEEETKKGIMVNNDENVKNWFSMDLDETIEDFEFKKGYYSIKDKISAILENEEGESVLRKYLCSMLEHEMFNMIKGMPLSSVFSLQKDMFPKLLQLNVNKELSKIKKDVI